MEPDLPTLDATLQTDAVGVEVGDEFPTGRLDKVIDIERKASRALSAALRLADILQRQRMLALLMDSWRRVAEDSQQSRRENMFDSMGQQVQAAKNRCEAFETLSERSVQVIEALQVQSLVQLAISAWRSAAWLGGECQQQDGCGTVRLSDQDLHQPMPVAHSFAPLVRVGSPAGGSMSVPRGGALDHASSVWQLWQGSQERASSCHKDWIPASTIPALTVPASTRPPTPTRRSPRDVSPPLRGPSVEHSRPQSPTRSGHIDSTAVASTAVGCKSGAQRSGRQAFGTRDSAPAEAVPAEIKKTLPRGPERFFYDTTGYTGCARFGGAAVVDKENLVVAARLKGSMSLPVGPRVGPAAPPSISTPREAPALTPAVAAAGRQGTRESTPTSSRRMVPLR